MEHKIIKQKLIFYLEKSLSEDEMKSISEHLINCSDCRLFFEELKLNWQILEEDKQIVVSPYFYSKLKAKLENAGTRVSGKFSRYLQPAFFVITLVIAINFGIWMGSFYSSAETSVYQEAGLLSLDDMSQEPIEQFLINFE